MANQANTKFQSLSSSSSQRGAAYNYLYLLLGFIFGSIFWIFYPGRTCTDSASHIQQAVEGVFNAHHARLTSYLLSWLPNYELLPNYAWFFLLNIVLTLAFIPFFIRFTLAKSVHASLEFFVTAILSLITVIVFAPLTITVWKDALLNSTMISMAILATVLVTGTHLRRYLRTIVAALGIFLACAALSIRPNSLLAVIPFMVVFLWVGVPRVRNKILRGLVVGLLAIGIPIASVFVVRVIMPATPADQEEHIMNNDLIGMHAYGADLQPDPGAPEEVLTLISGIKMQKWDGELGNCWEYQMPRSLTYIKQVWVDNIIKYPMIYLRVRYACFNNLLRLPQGRPPIAYSGVAFSGTHYIKEFIPVSPVRDRTIALFDQMYTKFAYGSLVLTANLILLVSSWLGVYFFRDRTLLAAAVMSLSAAVFFAGYFFIITTGDFRFITWVLSSVVLSSILWIVFLLKSVARLLSNRRKFV